MSMMSKEDYLAVSTEYQKEKEALRKQYRNKMIIGMVILAIGIIVVPAILVPLVFDTDLTGFAVFGISAVVITIGGIIAGVNASAMEKKPQELGVKYYQQYVADYNAKHRQ